MDYAESNKKTYSAIAEHWNTKRSLPWEPVCRFLESFDKREGLALLDAACGTGRHLECALKSGFAGENLIGCDFAQGLLDVTQSKGFRTKPCNLEALDFKDESFDVVLCIASVPHLLERKAQEKCLAELFRVLKKGGKALITTWHPESFYTEQSVKKGKMTFIGRKKKVAEITYTAGEKTFPRYYYFFGEKEIEDLCRDAGFRIPKKEMFKENLCLTLEK